MTNNSDPILDFECVLTPGVPIDPYSDPWGRRRKTWCGRPRGFQFYTNPDRAINKHEGDKPTCPECAQEIRRWLIESLEKLNGND